MATPEKIKKQIDKLVIEAPNDYAGLSKLYTAQANSYLDMENEKGAFESMKASMFYMFLDEGPYEGKNFLALAIFL